MTVITPPAAKPSPAAIVRMGTTLAVRRLAGAGHRVAGKARDGRTGLEVDMNGVRQLVLVRSNLAPKPSGGTGKAALDWWFPLDLRADFLALVDLSEERVWLLPRADALRYAQQDGSSSGKAHLYMHVDQVDTRAGHARTHLSHFSEFLLAAGPGTRSS